MYCMMSAVYTVIRKKNNAQTLWRCYYLLYVVWLVRIFCFFLINILCTMRTFQLWKVSPWLSCTRICRLKIWCSFWIFVIKSHFSNVWEINGKLYWDGMINLLKFYTNQTIVGWVFFSLTWRTQKNIKVLIDG